MRRFAALLALLLVLSLSFAGCGGGGQGPASSTPSKEDQDKMLKAQMEAMKGAQHAPNAVEGPK